MVRSRIEEAEWISRGKSNKRRAVTMERTRGTRENNRRLKTLMSYAGKRSEITHPTVSPQVGSWSPSHMKLPTKAQIAEIKRVAGMNTDVATMTGRTNTRRRKRWTYATRALINVRIVSKGTVCSRVVYGSDAPDLLSGLWMNRSRTEKKTHTETPVHQIMVQCESLNLRRPRVICRGSGRENTSIGRAVPSLGSSD